MEKLENFTTRLSNQQAGLLDVLQRTTKQIYGETRVLNQPFCEVNYDAVRQVTRLELGEVPEGSAISITETIGLGIELSSEEMRKFQHNFTFMILSKETDQQLQSKFPIMRDGFDTLTPDVIHDNGHAIVTYEFGTTINNAAVSHHFVNKMEKYAAPISDRVSMMRSMRGRRDTSYWLSPIIVSTNRVAMGVEMAPTNDLINELCARYRFATAVLREAANQGLRIGESPVEQELISLVEMCNAIKPKWEVSDGTGREMSKENIMPDGFSNHSNQIYGGLLYNSCLSEGFKKMKIPNKCEDDIQRDLQNYHDTIIGTRMDPKSIIQLPGCLPGPCSDLGEVPVSLQDHYMAKLWDEVIVHVRDNDIDLTERTVQEELKIALADEADEIVKELKPARKEFHRLTLDYDEDVGREIAKVGVRGKKYKNDGEVRTYREDKKEGFSIEVDTSDLDSFFHQKHEAGKTEIPNHLATVNGLIRAALEVHGEGTDETGFKLQESWLSSKEGQYFNMISEVGTELSISLQQHVCGKQFILKKLPGYDLWMLIRPTNSTSGIFVSFLMKTIRIEILPTGITKNLINLGSYFCTEFVSFNSSKLVNIVKAGPTSLSMLGQWARYYEFPQLVSKGIITIDDVLHHSDARTMFYLSMFVLLEDKHQTEEIMTSFRYISMEKFSRMCPDPTKMIEKFPTILRSRFQVWVLRKLESSLYTPQYQYMKYISKEIEQDPNDSSSSMAEELIEDTKTGEWHNLINPYTGSMISEPAKLIELYYLGYAKNKDEVPSMNTEFELVRKIIKYEDQLSSTNPQLFGRSAAPILVPPVMLNGIPEKDNLLLDGSIGLSSDTHYQLPKMNFHEWSNRAVLAAAENMRKYFHLLYGKSWEEEISNQIRNRFRKVTWEQIGTLKASSIYDAKRGKEIESGKVKSKRVKVITALLSHPDYLKKKPWEVLPLALEWVDGDGGLTVDIFKKNQHGGLREIYVLEFRSRLIQLFIEELARAICENLPIEVMMHPDNKIKKPQEHVIRSAKKGMDFKASCNSSNDAKVWNQGHHVNKFAQFLCKLLPEQFHGLVINILKQWRHKRIALPNGVLNLLLSQPDVKFYDPIDQMLANAYLGRENQPWMQPGNSHLDIESGMMQGILHYNSSLFHAAMLMYRDNLFKAMCVSKGWKIETTDLVSSDDSSRMTDCFSNNAESLRETLLYARADHFAIEWFSQFFGIWMSPKSTMCAENVLEFNSEFFFRASLARPTIKWAYAALNLVEVESLYERQEVFYNLCSQLLEGGGGFWQAHVTQLAQAHMHYRLLGSGTNKLWFLHSNALVETNDPSLGFFLLDNPRSTGFFGLDYNFWKVLTQNTCLQSRIKNQMVDGELTTTTSGALTGNVQVRFGNRQKARKLIDDASSILDNWRDTLSVKPEILYKFPKTFEDTVIRLLVKLTSPSVTTSLSKGNEISRMIAASVYIISRQANTIGSAWISTLGHLRDSAGDDEKKLRKVSLIKLAHTIPPRLLMEDEDFEVLFPNKTQYENINTTLMNIDRLKMVSGGTRKCLRSHVAVFSQMSIIPFSLEQMVRWKWFNEYPAASASYLERIWRLYTGMVPWLRSEIDETFGASPYEDHIQMRNFIARQTFRTRTVHLTGSPVKTSETRDMVLVSLIRNQYPGLVLLEQGMEALKPRTSGLDDLQHGMACIAGFFWKDHVKTKKALELMRKIPQVWKGEDRRFHQRGIQLAVMQAYAKCSEGADNWRRREETEIKSDEFRNILHKSKLGVLGGFTIIQKKTSDGKWTGLGKWAGKIGSAFINLEMRDGELTKIITDNVARLRMEIGLLKKLLVDLDVQTQKDKSFIGCKYHLCGLDINTSGLGTPIHEDKEFRYHHDFSIKNIIFKFEAGHFILVQNQSRDRSFEIMRYWPCSADFRFTTDLKLNWGSIFHAWCTNKPLAAPVLVSIFNAMTKQTLRKDSEYQIIEMREFFKIILLSTMQSNGWNVNETELQFLVGIDQSFEISEDIMQMVDDMTFLGDSGEQFFQEIENNDDPDDPAKDLLLLQETDYLGIEELLDFKFSESRATLGDVRKVHKICADVVTHWGSLLGRRGRTLMMNKSFKEDDREIALLIGDLLDWQMLEVIPEMQEADTSALEILQEFI
uniref:RNA-directed RNA polymerase L n=1 Tax=Cryptocercus punctulatus phenuivirus 1 TaxID=3133457 RepID=A0AAT9JG24_9VIRU